MLLASPGDPASGQIVRRHLNGHLVTGQDFDEIHSQLAGNGGQNGVSVTDNLPNAMFKVDIGNGHTILATISGKLRMNFIKILPGDKVTVQMSPYDLTRGRITWRSK